MKQASKLALTLLTFSIASWGSPVFAASHREAPLTALDPAADNTDVYAFVSYDKANLLRAPADRRVTFIMNFIPGQDPSDGPNYFNFDDEVRYAINIDNDQNGKADDIVYEFRFKTENRPVGGPGGLTSPLPYLGNPHIPSAVPLQGITSLDGPGSEGLTRRQTYTVTEIRNGRRYELFSGRKLIAVPSNVGPATMPNYPALAAQGFYSDSASGIRVFAGQRAETFYIDLGAVFDTLNLRRRLPALTGPGEDSDNVNPFGVNRFSGANVSTIAIEVPISRVTSDGKPATVTKYPVIGVYAEADRHKIKVLHVPGEVATEEAATEEGPFVQVSRMANPLVNELIITTPFKDRWNASEPENEAQFPSVLQKSGGCHRAQSCFWSADPSNRWFASEQPHRSDEHSAQISRPSPEWQQLRPALRGTIAARPARAAYRSRAAESAGCRAERGQGGLAKWPASE